LTGYDWQESGKKQNVIDVSSKAIETVPGAGALPRQMRMPLEKGLNNIIH